MTISLVLHQPDIAQNTGTILRLAACVGVPVELIEPAGFIIDGSRMRRGGMDYLEAVQLTRHASFAAFQATRSSGRLVLLTTQGSTSHLAATYQPDDFLVLGRETAGVPPEVHEAAALRVRIPMRNKLRSLNVAVAAAIVLAEALRQTNQWPVEESRGGIQS